MDRTDQGLAPILDVEPGRARYRHPQGWTILLPVPDVERPLPTQVVDGATLTLVDGHHT